jgi:protein-S-isoprenylcysteine O-methyltransferase Ste14
MSIALTRSEAGYRIHFQGSRPAAPSRSLGDVASKFAIVALFSLMVSAIAQDSARTGDATGLLLLASEALVVALTVIRRTAGEVDRTWKARLLTIVATFGPPLVRPDSIRSLGPEMLTVALAGIGLIIVVLGKLSLGRSFGLAPANRGVVSTGMYRFLRHPIYLGYLVTHLGFLIANPTTWNFALLLTTDIALLFRAVCEEQTLARDSAYRSYMDRVRWRVVPGLF